jgi:hypothetical protein
METWARALRKSAPPVTRSPLVIAEVLGRTALVNEIEDISKV